MAEKEDQAGKAEKPEKQEKARKKRPSKGQRKYNRRMKQQARKESGVTPSGK